MKNNAIMRFLKRNKAILNINLKNENIFPAIAMIKLTLRFRQGNFLIIDLPIIKN